MMSVCRLSSALGLVLLAGPAAIAQPPQPPAPAAVAVVAVQPCTRERALAAAEDTTPGILRELTRESLSRCLAAAGIPAGTGR